MGGVKQRSGAWDRAKSAVGGVKQRRGALGGAKSAAGGVFRVSCAVRIVFVWYIS